MSRQDQWLFEMPSAPVSSDNAGLEYETPLEQEWEILAGNYYNVPLTEDEWEVLPSKRRVSRTNRTPKRNSRQATLNQRRQEQSSQLRRSNVLGSVVAACPPVPQKPFIVDGWSQYQKAVTRSQKICLYEVKAKIVNSFQPNCQPFRIVRIAGYADHDTPRNLGREQKISEERAQVVTNWLKKNVGDSIARQIRWFPEGRGATPLRAAPTSEKERKKNRRVEITLEVSNCLALPGIPLKEQIPSIFNAELVRQNLDFHNQDNPKRTTFYLEFWKKFPEIPWALQAHLVSRNAGYQMSDLLRYQRLLAFAILPASMVSLLVAATGLPIAILLDQLFRFLEAGNFLIFHDVAPQLVAYSVAKRLFECTGDRDSALVFDRLLPLGVDKLIVQEWRQFFQSAIRAKFWSGVPGLETDPAVIRHSIALVVNEQNYIEDRLLKPLPGATKYVSLPGVIADTIFKASSILKLTKLLFSRSAVTSPATPFELLLLTLGNFSSLEARIETGRKLYVGTLLVNPSRTNDIKRWAQFGVRHNGSRQNYDPIHFDPSPATPSLTGFPKFSPPLSSGHLPGWPGSPASVRTWSTIPGRTAIFSKAVSSPLPGDPFIPPNGKSLIASPSRSVEEILL
jgi:hypothetical protein